jgi:hypothetical protein
MLVHTVWQSVLTILVPETREEVTSLAEEADMTAAGLDDPYAAFWGKVALLHTAIQYADIDAADAHLGAVAELADAVRQPVMRWIALWCRSWRSYLAGRLDEAESLTEQGFDIANESGQPDAIVVYAAQLCEIRAMQGRVDEIVELLEQAVDENPGVPSFAAMLANVYSQDDADANARALLDRAAGGAFANLPHDFLWLVGMTNYAETATHLRDADAAAVLYERLKPWAEHVAYNCVHVKGSVEHYLGLLAATRGEHDCAITHFTAAAAVHERMEAPLFLARTQLGLAESLIERGAALDAARAGEMLELATTAAAELGASTLERRSREMLQARSAG